jgi:hypothetical protein
LKGSFQKPSSKAMAMVGTISVFFSEERVEVAAATAAATEFCKLAFATTKTKPQANSTTSSEKKQQQQQQQQAHKIQLLHLSN